MLGEKLKELRKKNNLKQKDVASKLELPRGTYAQYEIGRREPNLETMGRLASFFGVTIDYLLDEDSSDNEGNFIGNGTVKGLLMNLYCKGQISWEYIKQINKLEDVFMVYNSWEDVIEKALELKITPEELMPILEIIAQSKNINKNKR